MNKVNTVSKLLQAVRLRLSEESGTVLTQKELAIWYGIDPVTFNKYYKGKRAPTGEFLTKIGAKTPEVYDILGLERPDRRILEIEKLYKDAPAGLKDRLYEQLKKVFEELGAHPLD